jgi:hypothetical protein
MIGCGKIWGKISAKPIYITGREKGMVATGLYEAKYARI